MKRAKIEARPPTVLRMGPTYGNPNDTAFSPREYGDLTPEMRRIYADLRTAALDLLSRIDSAERYPVPSNVDASDEIEWLRRACIRYDEQAGELGHFVKRGKARRLKRARKRGTDASKKRARRR